MITANSSRVIVEFVLSAIVPLLLPIFGNDRGLAREAAFEMLAEYRARTAEELRLAGEILCFSLQALKALAEASQPNLPATQVRAFRAAAVGLRRSEAQAQRKLDSLQKARRSVAAVSGRPETPMMLPDQDVAPAESSAEPVADKPDLENAAITSVPAAAQGPGSPHPAQTPVIAHNPTHARQLAEAARKASLTQRIIDSGKRGQAAHLARQAEAQPTVPATAPEAVAA